MFYKFHSSIIATVSLKYTYIQKIFNPFLFYFGIHPFIDKLNRGKITITKYLLQRKVFLGIKS